MKYLSLLVFVLFLFTACDKGFNTPPECEYEEVIPISGANMADTFALGDPIIVTVDVALKNGCGNFKSFEDEVTGSDITLSAIGKFKGCTCTAVIKTEKPTYTFTPSQSGDYVFTFTSPGNTSFQKTVYVK